MAAVIETKDGQQAIVAANGDPILKLGEGGTVLYRFGDHVLDSRAAELSDEALSDLAGWCERSLGEREGRAEQGRSEAQ